jgi:hypothetical protein
MTKIMYAWPLASAGMRDPAAQQQFPVQPVDGRVTQRAVGWRREEVGIGRAIAHDLRVGSKALYQGQGWWNEPVLSKFALTHRQDSPNKVNVGHPQVQHLANPQAAAIQEPEHFRHDEMPHWGSCGRRKLVSRLEQPLNLGVRQNAWRETFSALCRQ